MTEEIRKLNRFIKEETKYSTANSVFRSKDAPD
jgi:hypothetical protein